MLERLIDVPSLYTDEIALYLWDRFDVWVDRSTISRSLKRLDSTRKQMQTVAAQRDPELRDDWLRRLCGWRADQLIFVDESAAMERTALRKWGWAPRGQLARQSVPLKRSERWSILPAYGLDGYLGWLIRQGSITAESFNEFIRETVLPRCNPWPGPQSVIVLDNASIHRSQVC